MNRFFSPALIAALLLAAASPAAAQSIDTNRPGFSFTPGVVGKGRWQVETGIGYTQNDSDSETLSLPNAEIRYGTGAYHIGEPHARSRIVSGTVPSQQR